MELRYVELDASGVPFHENHKSWATGPTEDTVWAEIKESARARGHTLIRIACNDPKRDRNPVLTQIEADGRGGIRAKAEYPDALTGIRLVSDA